MTEQEGSKVVRAARQALPEESLPYRVELWDDAKGETVERVLARASSVVLGRAIFKAALDEHPDRRITLCRHARVIADSRSRTI